jgi:hypothetical protein
MVGVAPHGEAQALDGLAAQDLILSGEIIVFGRPRDIHRVFRQLVDVGVLG